MRGRCRGVRCNGGRWRRLQLRPRLPRGSPAHARLVGVPLPPLCVAAACVLHGVRVVTQLVADCMLRVGWCMASVSYGESTVTRMVAKHIPDCKAMPTPQLPGPVHGPTRSPRIRPPSPRMTIKEPAQDNSVRRAGSPPSPPPLPSSSVFLRHPAPPQMHALARMNGCTHAHCPPPAGTPCCQYCGFDLEQYPDRASRGTGRADVLGDDGPAMPHYPSRTAIRVIRTLPMVSVPLFALPVSLQAVRPCPD
jgi:hypothetical protein